MPEPDQLRPPPHSIEAEEALIGALLLKPELVEACSAIITAGDFYAPSNGHVYDAILTLHTDGKPVDAVTVSERLRANDLIDQVGGSQFLLSLLSAAPTTDATRYANVVRDKARLRRLIGEAREVILLGMSDPADVDAAIESAERRFYDLAETPDADAVSPIGVIADDALKHLEAIEQGTVPKGVPTGLVELDKIITGLRAGTLTVIAARPSLGKSALALNIASNVAIREKTPVLFLSLEMTTREVGERLLYSESRVHAERGTKGQLTLEDWQKLAKTNMAVTSVDLWVDDSADTTVLTARSKARRLKQAAGGLGLVVIDYLQLMASDHGQAHNDSRHLALGAMTRGLKVMAKELDVPVMVLSQLNRAVTQRADHTPMLSDLRDSGGIESDADLVIFVHRPEMFDEDSDRKGIADLIVAKHRAGPTGTAETAFLGHYMKFDNMSPEPAAMPNRPIQSHSAPGPFDDDEDF